MTYELKLSAEQVKLISDSLIVRPYREVASLLATIQRQINEQQKQPAEALKPKAD